MRKALQSSVFLLLTIQICFAQEDYTTSQKGSLLGFGFIGADFTSLGKPKDASLKNTDYGMTVFYMQGLLKRVDWSIRYNGLFSDYIKDPDANTSGFVSEFEAALHGRPLTDNHLFQPFITAGVGIGYYGNKWAPYAPLGAGLQFNFSSTFYLFIQANYRATLNNKNLDNNLFYTLSFATSLSSPKPPPPPTQ